jgi:DNA-binding transcriptional MerR regulator
MAEGNPERYRMAQLEGLTGVGREAVRFYIREGLLPEPERTSKTMAWYSDEHVRLLHTIRRLKEDEMLPLSAIRAVLHDVESHPFTERQRQMLDRMRQRFALERRSVGRSHSRLKLADLLGLGAEDLRQAEAVGFIRADAELLADDEERLLVLWAEMRDAGLTAARGLGPLDMAFIVKASEQLFADGLTIFSQRLGDLSDAETDALLKVIIPNISRICGILHLRRVRSFVASFQDAAKSD